MEIRGPRDSFLRRLVMSDPALAMADEFGEGMRSVVSDSVLPRHCAIGFLVAQPGLVGGGVILGLEGNMSFVIGIVLWSIGAAFLLRGTLFQREMFKRKVRIPLMVRAMNVLVVVEVLLAVFVLRNASGS